MTTENIEHTPPARKQRMGAPQPPPPSETPREQAVPTRRQRMGAGTIANTPTPSTPAPRQRMGVAAPITKAVPEARQITDKHAEPQEAPRLSTPRAPRLIAAVAGITVAALLLVLLTRWVREFPAVQEFISTYPGHQELPDSTPTGIPAWMGWQHFLNMFFMVLIIRTGLLIRMEKRPPGYWQAKPKSFFSPHKGDVKKVSLSQWLHQALDVLWIVNGAVFIVLLGITGQWQRIVPTSWDIFPNMASTALQYVSLQWPDENGWIYYNALQMVAYFLTVYIAAPLAVLSGLRMSTWWSSNAERLNRYFPIEVARAIHFPVMLYFVGFTVIHVFLVFFTGALRNLNHMYTSRDVADAWGLLIFLVSVAVIAVGWFLTRPMFTTPLAMRMGKVTKN